MTRRAGRETVCRLIPEAFAAFETRQATVLGLDDGGGGTERERAAS